MPLEVDDLTVELGGRRVVDGVTFTVPTGGWLSVLGPNGAGKSTLLRAVAGLVPATGRVRLDGEDLCRLGRRARARRVALVPQRPELPRGMTVVDYVLLGRTAHAGFLAGYSRRDHDVVRTTLRRLDLLGLAHRELTTLSGGELRRAVIARALAQDASLLLLDEPTAALDVGRQQEVLELVDELRRERALIVVGALHDLTLAGQFADRLVLLDDGRVAVDGDARRVLTPETVRRHFGATVRILEDPGGVVVIPVREPVRGRDPQPITATPKTRPTR
ncbi:MAG TPA: ABC transporter ATP-binding protein [Actinobacteria bacterium]|nr:ABC transporter ATP-binding protein [Actinomycetota bacterium]